MHIMNEEPLKNLAKKNPSEPNQINTACIKKFMSLAWQVFQRFENL